MAASMEVMRAIPFNKKLSGWRKTEISEVKTKTKEFLSDRMKANNILEIISVLETEDSAIAIAAMNSLCTLFTAVIGRGELVTIQTENKELDTEKTAEEKYRCWLGERYLETTAKMQTFLMSDQKDVQQASMTCLLKCVHVETERGLKFPEKRLKAVLSALLSSKSNMKHLITHYAEYLQYEEVKFHTLRILHKRLERHGKSPNIMFLNNSLALLEHVVLGRDNRVSKDVDSEYQKIRHAFGTTWLSFLRKKLNSPLHRRVLVFLHEKVIPHMEHPLLLTDFLMDSYKMGGSISLLALNGIFILMQKHNLEFPDFYNKLYALFEPGIFYTKYRARFFYLADIFLSSTHLPAYLVAAFVKRLARLSLDAPPYCTKFIIPFIRNLLIRHPSLDKMLHNPDGPESLPSDPYIMEETNLAKCNALDSSLWELLALRQHYYPGVSMAAGIVEKQLPPAELDVSELLDLDMSDLIGGEAKRHKKDTVALNFERPSGILCTKTNMDKLWTL